eukprot:7191806-Lingulodinium_polyedra.AAC.1
MGSSGSSWIAAQATATSWLLPASTWSRATASAASRAPAAVRPPRQRRSTSGSARATYATASTACCCPRTLGSGSTSGTRASRLPSSA